MADGIATILGEEMQELEKRQRLGPKAVGCELNHWCGLQSSQKVGLTDENEPSIHAFAK